MEESINKGLKSLKLNDSDAAIRVIRDVRRVVVTGYDTGLPRDVVKSALRKHFASCGEITDVYIPKNYTKDNTLSKCGYIIFLGEGAVDKALQLKGSDVGGWNVSVTPFPCLKHANE
ncbi:PREDICTED: nucleolin 2-like [Camelina sativa]|uniref:Nucleolin 2-like n=1 Tax=Camelina sativa TaxID=90675 RepID=A0ABM0TBS3_CAMSA|nr:PREDICTED: nucleolin 2-like [Camelina sativa]